MSSTSERKERVSMHTAALNALFRQISADEITNDILLDRLYELGFDETIDLTTFLRKRQMSNLKFKDFLNAVSSDVTKQQRAPSAATPARQGGYSGEGGIFGGMSDGGYTEQRVSRVPRSTGGGVADAINFECSTSTMYETSSGSYGQSGTPAKDFGYGGERDRFVGARDANGEKFSGYSKETKSLSCPWGTTTASNNESTACATDQLKESDLLKHSSRDRSGPAAYNSGAWFTDNAPVDPVASTKFSRGRGSDSTPNRPIWGTDLDM